ncbi:DMT family transporter [Anaerolinea thermophila]|uniref:DMT family transporter n=3 Tax=Anaerolinea TaxID=233189 RepID=UPI0026F1229F|nr:DMT family transporter [Anaerolinea thermophila]
MGEIAALLTSVFWAFSSIIHTFAGRRVGPGVLNRARLLFAVIWILLTHWILQGTPFPFHATPERWFWLGLSGVVGLVLGDWFLFYSYVTIGARMGTLIMASVPMLSAVLAWIFLGETLTPAEIFGMVLVVAGISMVILDRTNGNTHLPRRAYWLGVLAGFGGALGQAGNLILAKPGLAGDFPSISGVAIRMVTATVVLWGITFIKKEVRPTLDALKDRRALGLILLGSMIGPFAGVWLSMVAIQNTLVGIASTLMALSPVILLPLSRWFFHESISWRAIAGTFICMAGTAALFLL